MCNTGDDTASISLLGFRHDVDSENSVTCDDGDIHQFREYQAEGPNNAEAKEFFSTNTTNRCRYLYGDEAVNSSPGGDEVGFPLCPSARPHVCNPIHLDAGQSGKTDPALVRGHDPFALPEGANDSDDDDRKLLHHVSCLHHVLQPADPVCMPLSNSPSPVCPSLPALFAGPRLSFWLPPPFPSVQA